MKKQNINFTSKFATASILSLALMVASLILIFTKGINFGVDFRGGAEVQIKFESGISVEQFRSDLSSTGFQISSVQSIGDLAENEYLIKVQATESNLNSITDGINTLLSNKYSDKGAEIRKTDIVGPKAGAELRESGFKAMIWAMLAIMIYVALRFEFKFAPGAVFALFHDVLITIGAFVLTGREFTLQTVAALLAIIGYSVNDTVIIFDRVRENMNEKPEKNLKENINAAINETLNRTIYTSATTLAVSFSMYILGGGVIHDFFFAICVGIIVGTYSSTFVATPITLAFDKYFPKKLPTRKHEWTTNQSR